VAIGSDRRSGSLDVPARPRQRQTQPGFGSPRRLRAFSATAKRAAKPTSLCPSDSGTAARWISSDNVKRQDLVPWLGVEAAVLCDHL
jgi:hypothetical protein